MERKKIDPNSRDYNFSDIEPDERFVQTIKEFWITVGVFGVFTLLMMVNLFVINKIDAFVMGFPLWIFVEICILIGMVIAVVLVVSYVYRDMDITPHGKLKSKGKKQA